jgi:L-alanine-DL-glutamate epimerase-like enolase superfamily enzyme
MKITDIQTVLLTGPCTNDPYLAEARHQRSAAFIEIHTDGGTIGLGETYAGYFCPELVPGIVEFFKPILIGQNVDRIDALWQRMYHCGNFWCRVGLGAIVLCGIEAALWDLKGKLENRPVHELLGGPKYETLPAYATGGPSNYPLEKLLAKAEFYLSLGFNGFKIAAGGYEPGRFYVEVEPAAAADFEAKKLQFLRQRLGDKVNILLDGHMGNSPSETWTLPTAAAVLDAVAPYKPFFFEEPLHYTDIDGYAQLRSRAKVPVAGGECLTAQCEWQVFAEKDCFDIAQPDASFTAGLQPFLQVAELFHKRGRKIAPHAWGAGGSLMQNVHCAFAAPNTAIVEVAPAYGPLHSEIIGDSFVMKAGQIIAPRTPGLGIRLSDEIKRRFPFIPGSGEYNSVPGKRMPEEQ